MLFSVYSLFGLIREAYVEILKPNKSNVILLSKCMSFLRRQCFNIQHLLEKASKTENGKKSSHSLLFLFLESYILSI